MTDFAKKKCKPCEGGVRPLSLADSKNFMKSIPDWRPVDSGKAIERQWVMKDFKAAISLMNAIAQVAEKEGHHPDIHLTGYKHLTIELSTHAIGGLSENDFISAAKIDKIPMLSS